jgi:hypothetical protein
VHREVRWENLREEERLKDLHVDGIIILKRTFKKSNEDVD